MFFWRKKSQKEQILENRHKRLKIDSSQYKFSWKNFLGYGSFFTIILMVAFWGQRHVGCRLLLNYPAKSRIVASLDFEYISDLKTKALKEQRRHMVLPVYKVDMSAFRNFSQKIEYLKTKLNQYAEFGSKEQKASAVGKLIEEFDTKYNILLDKDDVEILLGISSNLQRNRLMDESLFILQGIVQKGIFDDIDFRPGGEENFFSSISKENDDNERLQSKGNALRCLRMNLFIMDIEYEVANALLHVCKYGLVPNLVYDKQKTQEKINQFVERTPNVVIKVARGSIIVENGQMVTPEVYECYEAYFKVLENEDTYRMACHTVLLKKVFLIGFLFGIFVFILKIFPTRLNVSVRLKIVVGSTLIFNVILIRLVNIICQHVTVGQACLFASFATFLVPTFLSSLLITSLTDALVGFICTFFVVGVKAFIVYGTFESFLLDLLVGVFIVFLCRKVRFKEDIVRASAYDYFLSSLLVFTHGIMVQHLTIEMCLRQVAAIIVGGIFTIFLVLNLIPLLEKAFRYTTNMTFLSLTDYNHPLLKKLQMLAPGTYHHSLMVASLSEKVAGEIGANPLLCRCCSLYHDIGKLVKPEYFTENQKGEENPHKNQSPSMSAIILKSHVKEGVELAKMYKLPRTVIDIIQQHHGTTLMQYFYKKALLMKEEGEVVDEKIFHYDGPKPQFKESAIILLADAIEAASRSLEKVTPQSVQDLVVKIIKERIEMEQFNECNITLQDLDIIKKTFQMVLLSMLHSRVSYDKVESNQEAVTKN